MTRGKRLSFYSKICVYLALSGSLMLAYTNCSPTGGGLTAASSSGTDQPNGDNSAPGSDPNPGDPFTPPIMGDYPNGTVIDVADSAGLASAVASAQPGHVITLAPGNYTINRRLSLNAAGTADLPIVLRAGKLGEALITVEPGTGVAEGLVASGPHWIIENLDIQGSCPSASHSSCEHAIHIKGTADNLVIRTNHLHEFNAHIKGSANPVSGSDSIFADDVIIRNNRIRNSSVRMTSNPVALIDINGGRRWVVQSNRISDFAKGQGDGVSYGAFLKGNSKDGVFDGNFVVCSRSHTGGTRVGLSFGGGGNSPEFNNSVCEQSTCTNLHTGGIMRNNVIVNCSDVGIYLNRSNQTKIFNNTLLNTSGIDVRFATSSADIRNNISNSTARTRDGGSMTQSNNLWNSDLAAIFLLENSADVRLKNGQTLIGKGAPLGEVTKDWCGTNRFSTNDIGAVQYSSSACATAIWMMYGTL